MNIYLITNNVNGKVYVGQTSRTPELRLRRHLWNARKGAGSRFYHAIRKHGPDAFSVVMLEAVEANDINEAERFWISYLRSLGAVLYNMADGGEGCSSKEISKKLSRAHTGVKLSAEHRAAIGQGQIGVQQSPETCARRGRTIKSKWSTKTPEEREAIKRKISETTSLKIKAWWSARKEASHAS